MRFAFNFAFTLATLFSYQSLLRAENTFSTDEEGKKVELFDEEKAPVKEEFLSCGNCKK